MSVWVNHCVGSQQHREVRLVGMDSLSYGKLILQLLQEISVVWEYLANGHLA